MSSKTLNDLPSGQKKLHVIREWALSLVGKVDSEWDPKQCSVIDIGSGIGMISIPLAQAGFSVTAFDIDPADLDTLEKLSLEYQVFVTTVLGDARYLEASFPDDTFDLAIASEVFEHLMDPVAFAKSIERIVKVDGSLIITIPNGFSLLESYRRARRIGRITLNRIKGLELKTSPDAHVQWFTLTRFIRLIEDSTSFRFQSKRHSNVISGFLYHVFGIRSLTVERFDCWLADRFPSFLVGGWYLLFRKAHTDV